MSMTVDDVCRYLDNRLGGRLVFEGHVVRNLSHKQSVCRQLYERWRTRTGKNLSYEKFKKSLRFRIQNGGIIASVAYDPTPMIAAAGLAAAGAVGLGAYYGASYSAAKSSEGASAGPKSNPSPPDLVKSFDFSHSNDDGLRPAVFENINNSCYFHSAMLMLYQMKEWFLNRVCNQQQHALLLNLDGLLKSMDDKSLIRAREVYDVYQVIQIELFPGSAQNRQQDANEFFVKLFKVMSENAGCDLKPVSFGTTIETFEPLGTKAMEIRSLIFEAKPIDVKMVDEFEVLWGTLSNDQKKLNEWTVIDTKIVARDAKKRDSRKSGYQPGLARGDANRFDSLEFPTRYPILRRKEVQTPQVLNLVLPADRSDVCQLVADILIRGQTTMSQVLPVVGDLDAPVIQNGSWTVSDTFDVDPEALFNLKTKAKETYTQVGQYLMVLIVYDPATLSCRNFMYSDSILVGADTYVLTCVIYRQGCNSSSGHYTAALLSKKLGWVYYNDTTQTRIPVQNLTEIKGAVPFMLLFQKEPPQ